MTTHSTDETEALFKRFETERLRLAAKTTVSLADARLLEAGLPTYTDLLCFIASTADVLRAFPRQNNDLLIDQAEQLSRSVLNRLTVAPVDPYSLV